MLNLSGVLIKQAKEKVKSMVKGFNYVTHTEVYVGITEETDVERESGITNAQLLYLQENGVPSHNIPPRPVIAPALDQDEVKDKMKKMIRQAMVAAIVQGNLDKAEQCYEKAGMVGRDACKKYITDGDKLTPNSPATIAKKGSSTPLIDTSSMLNSITYAVRRK
ncbi:MAG: hypothetical protein J6S78_05965 [Lachnospiraceae bacterium]|nr:hypothetical protein [Lachnospiraceae bacterium]